MQHSHANIALSRQLYLKMYLPVHPIILILFSSLVIRQGAIAITLSFQILMRIFAFGRKYALRPKHWRYISPDFISLQSAVLLF